MNTTTTGCPSVNAVACNHRTIWGLLASCCLTLLICVWHAIHPALPLPNSKRIHRIIYWFFLIFITFFVPEIMVVTASDEWYKAKQMTSRVHAAGHHWWTLTHSYFVMNGGFALCDDTGIKEVNLDEFLSLVDAGKLINPVVTKEDIKDKSSSDGLAKAILIVQLSWFITQIAVRLVHHLAVTLIELDTVCMALLALPLIFWWWHKPRCPGRPHFFYTRDFFDNAGDGETLHGDNDLEKLLNNSTIKTDRGWGGLLLTGGKWSDGATLSLVFTWVAFGALHALAWNYDFPTGLEKMLWRTSSLTLAGSPIILCCVVVVSPQAKFGRVIFLLLLAMAMIARLLLVGLVLASLRSLPSSAYEIIPWTNYIPHL